MDNAVKLVVVGSVGVDTIETPYEKREGILGGSASYACAAASRSAPVGMVGVVGTDFPEAYESLYREFGIDLLGLQKQDGETFRWAGVYKQNMDERETLSTELNVFADFSPELPEAYRSAPFLFLANIGPELQLRVLDQVERPEFVAMDTMDLWIDIQRDALLQVIGKVDMLTLNESEARHLTREHFLPKAAAQLLELGPRYVLIKKGEHGSLLFSADETFVLGAFPLGLVADPTGAGDAFAGGLMGSLAAAGEVTPETLRRAMVHGSVVASFGVEAFSLERLRSVTVDEIEARFEQFCGMLRIPEAAALF
jgi:sugar/nucleoside kinase (ribokinase family)